MITIAKQYDFKGLYSRTTIKDFLNKEMRNLEAVVISMDWFVDGKTIIQFTGLDKIPNYTSRIAFTIIIEIDPHL